MGVSSAPPGRTILDEASRASHIRIARASAAAIALVACEGVLVYSRPAATDRAAPDCTDTIEEVAAGARRSQHKRDVGAEPSPECGMSVSAPMP